MKKIGTEIPLQALNTTKTAVQTLKKTELYVQYALLSVNTTN